MSSPLKNTFYNLLQKYTNDEASITILWNEIDKKYNEGTRYYHSLAHLDILYHELFLIKDMFDNWDAILFALFYHDVIYSSIKKNNEEKSAALLQKRLFKLKINVSLIELSVKHIIATKSHDISDNNDTNLFTDADLSILGASWSEYQIYYTQVRNEYKIYPTLIYNPGRKKVLQHFLSMNQIYKTTYFRDKYELIARSNLERELNLYI